MSDYRVKVIATSQFYAEVEACEDCAFFSWIDTQEVFDPVSYSE